MRAMAASALAPRTMPGVLFARGMQRATDTRSAHPMQFHKLVRKVVADGHICMVAENAFPSIVMENLRTVKRCPRLHHQYRGEHHESVDRHDEWDRQRRGEHGEQAVSFSRVGSGTYRWNLSKKQTVFIIYPGIRIL